MELFNQYVSDDRIKIVPWIKDWPKKAKESDLVINEAGYFSTNELITNKVPGILIPGHRRIDKYVESQV